MKKIALVVLFFASIVVFSSCEPEECTCSAWEDGVDKDPNPTYFDKTDLDNLNVRNCAGLNDHYASLGLGYNEKTGKGIRCK